MEKNRIMMQRNFANVNTVVNHGISSTGGCEGSTLGRHPKYCAVSVSSIKDLFSAGLSNSSSLSPLASIAGDENRASYSNGDALGPKLRQSKAVLMLTPTTIDRQRTKVICSTPAKMNITQKRRHHRGENLQLPQRHTSMQHNEAKYQHQHITMIHRFSAIGLSFYASKSIRLNRNEFLSIQRAFNLVEADVRCFETQLSDYLNRVGHERNFPKQKSMVIKMLCTSHEKFDEMITKHYLMQGHCSRIRHQETVKKRLGELYRLILICDILGFIGLTTINHAVASGQLLTGSTCRKEEETTTSISKGPTESTDRMLVVTKLRDELEEAMAEIRCINERIFSWVKWIHSQCPSAPKTKQTHLMCVKLGLKVAERLLLASAYTATKRAFFTWRLDSQLNFNKLKIQEFNKCVSQSNFYRILSIIRTRILEQHIKIWRFFLKKKRKEERLASSLGIQRVWRGYFFREHAKMIRFVKFASKLQSIARLYLTRHLLCQKRIEKLKLVAAIIFQRKARRIIALQRFKSLVREIQSVVKMQVFLRIFHSKITVTRKQCQWKQNRKVNFALILQRAWQLHIAFYEKHNLRKIWKARMVQCIWRSYVARKIINLIRGVIHAQAWTRRLLSIKEREIRKLIHVMRIQSAQRSHMAHIIMKRKLEVIGARKIQAIMASFMLGKQLRRIAEGRAARAVQRCIKEFHCNRIRLRKESTCRAIQSAIRIRSARVSYTKKKEEKMRVDLILQFKRKQLLYHAVCKLQQQFRMLQAFNNLQRLRKKKMVTFALQNQTRCFLARKKLKENKNMMAVNRRRVGAKNIQHFLSNRLQRLREKEMDVLKRRKSASIIIQRKLRQLTAMTKRKLLRFRKIKQLLRSHAAATLIQSGHRSSIANSATTALREQKKYELKALLSSAIRIQSCIRQKQARWLKSKLQQEQEQQQRAYAMIRIQNAFRRHQSRKKASVLICKEEYARVEKVTRTLIIMQCWWRAREARARLCKAAHQVEVLRNTVSLLESAEKKAAMRHEIQSSEKKIYNDTSSKGDGFFLTRRFPVSLDTFSAKLEEKNDQTCISFAPSEVPEFCDRLEKIMYEMNGNSSSLKVVKEDSAKVEKLQNKSGSTEHLWELESEFKTRLTQLKQWEVKLKNREESIKKRQLQAELELQGKRNIEIPISFASSDWTEYWDANTSHKFYFHKDSRHVAWKTPPRNLLCDECSDLTDGELTSISLTDDVNKDTDVCEFLSYEYNSLSNHNTDAVPLVYMINDKTDEMASDPRNDFVSIGTAQSTHSTSIRTEGNTSASADSNWEQVHDSNTGFYYWYNIRTGISQWMDPWDETKGAIANLPHAKFGVTDENSTTREIPINLLESNLDELNNVANFSQMDTKPEEETWAPYFDVHSGRHYWYSTKTGEGAWENPQSSE